MAELVREDIKRVFVKNIRTNLTEVTKKVQLLETSIKTFIQKGFAANGTDPTCCSIRGPNR